MPFVTTWERRGQRIGREEGLQVGLREGRHQLAISLMPEACGPIPEPIRHRLEEQEPTVLTQFVRAAAVGFQSWDEADRWLDEHGASSPIPR